MSDKILDCSTFSKEEFENIQRGFKHFMERTHINRYFGYVDKKELKNLNRAFNYTDKRSFVKGGIVTAGVIWAGSEIKKYLDSKKAEPVEENVPNEEES